MMQQLDKSVPLFEDLVKRREAVFGRQHPETLRDIANLGVNYASAGRFDQALPLLEEGYKASKTIPSLRWVGPMLLEGYARAGETAQGTALAKDVIADARDMSPPDSPQLAGRLTQIGFTLLTLRAFAQAEVVLGESLAIWTKKEPNAWMAFNTQSLLGGALLSQQKYAAAEPLLLAGYQGIKEREKTIPLISRARLPEAADRLVALYTATNKPDEVKKWQTERAQYPGARTTSPAEKK
jgi:hypothetical protein